jgi:hypothetical protein
MKLKRWWRRKVTPQRVAFVLLGLALFGVLYSAMSMSMAPTAKADTTLLIGGADAVQEDGVPRHFYMSAINNGDFCKKPGDKCIVTNFSGAAGVLTPTNPAPLDQSIAEAVGPIVDQVKAESATDHVNVVAISAGAPVAQKVAEQLQNDPNGPAASKVSVFLEGGIQNGIGRLVPPGTHLDSIGYTPEPYAPTKYHTTVVTAQYDGMGAPTPDPLAHPLAAANNIAGAESAHVKYFTASLDDPINQVTDVGNTTYIELPNQGPLPLMQAGNSGGLPVIASEYQVQADIEAAGPQPLPGEQPPLDVPPPMVDQMIANAAPMFTQGINEQKDNLVNQLVPILSENSQMQQYIPPALMNDAPPAPVPDAVNMENAPLPAPDAASVVQASAGMPQDVQLAAFHQPQDVPVVDQAPAPDQPHGDVVAASDNAPVPPAGDSPAPHSGDAGAANAGLVNDLADSLVFSS